ncbi:hypothetical protein LIER_42616 [Lithospermum erythrorhizon]|uniref:Uncharacterized protein n=1 Tax=Lithospermum erythrorhizon TaxID=34254 RepID=A0AAV3NLZ6_LITER
MKNQKMKPIDDAKETVTIRAINKDKQGQKQVKKTEVTTHNIDSIKHMEKKMIDKGMHRQERHPLDGRPLGLWPKSGHGGKYTWEGPGDIIDNELDPGPISLDENDPNYVDEEVEGRSGVSEYVAGEVDVAKVAQDGVARVDVDHQLQTNM